MNSTEDEVDILGPDGKVTLTLKKPLKLRDYKDIIMKLPCDDAVWYIKLDNDFQDSGAEPGAHGDADNGEEGPPISFLGVLSADDTVGARILSVHAVPLEAPQSQHQVLERMETQLVEAMLKPMWGAPRRPRLLDGDPFLPIEEMSPAVYGMYNCQSGEVPSDFFTAGHHENPMRACAECHCRGARDMFTLCPQCEVVFYCNPICRGRDCGADKGPHSHAFWCQRMKNYMADTHKLALLHFDFMPETSHEEFDLKKYRAFLSRHGVLGKGYWRRECSASSKDKPPPEYGELKHDDTEDPFALPDESQLLQNPPKTPAPDIDQPLRTWLEYYEWKGFPRNSPIAILLQWPMTLYYILTTCLPRDFPDQPHLTPDTKSLTIHILGTEKEADIVPVFFELGALLPNTELDIHMLGPQLSKQVHGKVCTYNNVRVQLRRKYYHKSELAAQKPTLVIGFNAGLAAYPTWCDTLRTLRKHKSPAYFTDYCHYSADCAKAPMEGLGLGDISEVEVNPFRSPVRKYCEEQVMPWYSNGFLFHLKYMQDLDLD